MVSTLEQMQVPNGTGPGVRSSTRTLLASRTRCNVQGAALVPPPNLVVLKTCHVLYFIPLINIGMSFCSSIWRLYVVLSF